MKVRGLLFMDTRIRWSVSIKTYARDDAPFIGPAWTISTLLNWLNVGGNKVDGKWRALDEGVPQHSALAIMQRTTQLAVTRVTLASLMTNHQTQNTRLFSSSSHDLRVRWLGGVMVTTLDLRWRVRECDSRRVASKCLLLGWVTVF